MKDDKITFTMDLHSRKVHSNRFDFREFTTLENQPEPQAISFTGLEKFKPNFYIPHPFGQSAKRVRVTIEVVE